MKRIVIYVAFILIVLPSFINSKSIRKSQSNETLLVGQIHGPQGSPARNLVGMLLGINVFANKTALHSSLVPITTSTFPLNYSIRLTNRDYKLDHGKNFRLVTMIWQPAFINEENVKLSENEIGIFNMTMRSIKFVIIRGEIVHNTHDQNHDLPSKLVKLELIDDKHGHVVDQVDFQCNSTTYPCLFEYWLDTAHVKSKTEYRLEAVMADRILPHRKKTDKKHQPIVARAKTIDPQKFTIDPTIDTEINNFKIIVEDIQSIK